MAGWALSPSVDRKAVIMSSASELLCALIPPLVAGEYVELRATQAQTGEIRRGWYRSPVPMVRDATAWAAEGYHVWFGTNPRLGQRGGDKQVTRAAALPADIDDKLWGARGAAAAAVRTFDPAPSIAVDSGGGTQCYWLLEEPADLTDPRTVARYSSVATRLAWALCGVDRKPDTISNPERVLRLPETLNVKYEPARPVRLLWCNRDVRYGLRDLETWCDEHAPWTAPEPPRLFVPCGPQDGVIADFNARTDGLGLLLAHWADIASQHGSVTYLRGRGHHKGIGATWNHYPDRLIVFAEHWAPFEPWRIPGLQRRGYDAFEISTLLEHGGNRSRAYRAALSAGFGQRVVAGFPTYTMHPGTALKMLAGGR